jgi:hypothetical protein
MPNMEFVAAGLFALALLHTFSGAVAGGGPTVIANAPNPAVVELPRPSKPHAAASVFSFSSRPPGAGGHTRR